MKPNSLLIEFGRPLRVSRISVGEPPFVCKPRILADERRIERRCRLEGRPRFLIIACEKIHPSMELLHPRNRWKTPLELCSVL